MGSSWTKTSSRRNALPDARDGVLVRRPDCRNFPVLLNFDRGADALIALTSIRTRRPAPVLRISEPVAIVLSSKGSGALLQEAASPAGLTPRRAENSHLD